MGAAWPIEILTLFPGLLNTFFETSLVGKAVSRRLLAPTVTNIRDFASPPHFKVDDTPYGGGAGMVMLPEPLYLSVKAARSRNPTSRVIALTPAGAQFNQRKAEQLSKSPGLILLCGRYEGFDQRVVDLVVDEELSIGSFVTMGGEVAAMTIVEATLRLRPDALHNADSVKHESFGAELGNGELVEAAQYTRPEEFQGVRVPEVLLSGDHAKIAQWRLHEAHKRTEKLKEGKT